MFPDFIVTLKSQEFGDNKAIKTNKNANWIYANKIHQISKFCEPFKDFLCCLADDLFQSTLDWMSTTAL